jgi:hypothetical protein
MLVQLWSNYGEYIENRVMSPTIAGAGEFDASGSQTEFVLKYHKWVNGTLHLNMTKPKSYMVVTHPIYPVKWVENCIQVYTEVPGKIQVFIYSM